MNPPTGSAFGEYCLTKLSLTIVTLGERPLSELENFRPSEVKFSSLENSRGKQSSPQPEVAPRVLRLNGLLFQMRLGVGTTLELPESRQQTELQGALEFAAQFL